MRHYAITAVKKQVERLLMNYLEQEQNPHSPTVAVEGIHDLSIEGSLLLWEIRVVLGILGKPWQCDALANGIYEALRPHNLTENELRVVLMSLHVEFRSMAREHISKRATIRYVMEPNTEVEESIRDLTTTG
jgi:hypothetical protein